jgi:hypothetical protein
MFFLYIYVNGEHESYNLELHRSQLEHESKLSTT